MEQGSNPIKRAVGYLHKESFQMWLRLAMPTPRRWRQENDQECRVILSYIMRLRSAWTTSDPDSENQKGKQATQSNNNKIVDIVA